MSNEKNARICDQNRLDDATIVAPELVGYESANALNLKDRNKFYRPDSKQFAIEIDLKSFQKNVSTFAICGGSDALFKISNQAVITLKGNSINLFDGGEPYSQQVTVSNLNAFLNVSDAQNPDGLNYRYWQVVIDDQYNPETIEIAYLYLGDNTILHRNIGNGLQLHRSG